MHGMWRYGYVYVSCDMKTTVLHYISMYSVLYMYSQYCGPAPSITAILTNYSQVKVHVYM